MSGNELVEKLRVAYQEWNDTHGQSVATWVDMMGDDVQLRSIADGAAEMEFSAPRNGKAAAHGYFSSLHKEWEMVFHKADEFIVDGERVAVFGSCAFKSRKTGKTAESPFAHRWLFRNGQIAEYLEFYDTAKAFAAATPDPK